MQRRFATDNGIPTGTVIETPVPRPHSYVFVRRTLWICLSLGKESSLTSAGLQELSAGLDCIATGKMPSQREMEDHPWVRDQHLPHLFSRPQGEAVLMSLLAKVQASSFYQRKECSLSCHSFSSPSSFASDGLEQGVGPIPLYPLSHNSTTVSVDEVRPQNR